MREACSRRRVVARVNYIAKWDESSWNGAGVGDERQCGCAGSIRQRRVCGGQVHDGGGIAVNYIAKWNGSSWTALDSGMGTSIITLCMPLAVSGSDLYVGDIHYGWWQRGQ